MTGKFDVSEAGKLAKNLAKNCGYSVFPCRGDNKRPTTLRIPEQVGQAFRNHVGR
jgi:hypothetical protein